VIDRYEQKEIKPIWTDEHKTRLWQDTEMANMKSLVKNGKMPEKDFLNIRRTWKTRPVDIVWWKTREKETGHDYDAFLDERKRWLPPELRKWVHKDMTSYDGEEPAFARMLAESLRVVDTFLSPFYQALKDKALLYRYTVMVGRTHGQGAQLQTFGKRNLTWYAQLRAGETNLRWARKNLKFSKLSGAIGNYGGLTPELEEAALRMLSLKPFYGATQIMPRVLYTPIANSLADIVAVIDNIATDIRLGARSNFPIYQEPFGLTQIGSSRMPQKKNTILTERLDGLDRLMEAYSMAIKRNIKTWEERAIEQSCVERVAWPDLFHVIVYALKTITNVISGLKVYPDNMLKEVIDMRGTYATGTAKDFLAEKGIEDKEAYKIVQLAAFNVFEPLTQCKVMRENPAKSFNEAQTMLGTLCNLPLAGPISIEDFIPRAELSPSAELKTEQGDIDKWNDRLRTIFNDPANIKEFQDRFTFGYLLKDEVILYEKILGK
jgi:adenylosuccinate lyase